jgi:NAD+ diphosphatase
LKAITFIEKAGFSMTYQFCPTCGTKLHPHDAGDDGQVPYCDHCQRFWFPTFADCVITLVATPQHEIALVKMPYLSTQYESFVSGYMKPGEVPTTSAVRELHEELGIHIDQITPEGSYWFGAANVLMHGFIAVTEKQPFVLSSELSTAHWVEAHAAHQYMFPDQPGLAATELYYKYLKSFT